MAGSMRVDGLRSAVTLNTGRATDGAMRLRIQAEPEVQKVSIESDGEVRLDRDAAATYSGEFRVAARLDEAQAAAARQTKNPGFRVKGKFALDDERLAFDEFRFETGPLDNPYSADGKGFVDFGSEPRFALSLDGAQMRLDEAIGAQAETAKLAIGDRLSALQESLLDLPRPSIPGTIEVNLPAVVAGDTTIRDVRLSAEPASDGWTVKSLAATLPGRATLEANGSLRTDGDLGFDGSLLLAIGQPSGFAAWAAQDVDDAIRRLPAAGFRADVELTQERQALRNLELGLGGATFRGEAERRQPSGARPTSVLKLTGDALDLDGLAAFASLFVSDLGVNRFAGEDLDLDVKAGPVNAAGLAARSVDAAFRLRDGLLEIDRLSIGDLAGATISATGTIRDFPANPSGSLDASLVAVDLAPAIDALAERYAGNAFVRGLKARAAGYRGLLEDARLDVVATAAANADGTTGVAISAQGTAGGTALSATLSGKGRPADPADADVSVLVSGRNDDATALLALYGLPVLPLGLTGPGETDFSLKGRLSGALATSLDLKAGDFSASFAGTAKVGDGLAFKGSAQLNAADIEPWLMTAGVGLPGMGTGLPVELEANADYADGLLVLDALSGTVDQGAVAGGINARIKDAKPHLTGQLTLDELNLEPLAAMVVGESALESSGQSWPSAPFSPKIAAPFTADLGIAAGTVTAGPAVTAYDASLALKLDDESLRLSDLSAKLHGGDLSGLFELKNGGGTGFASAQMKLAGADIAAVLGVEGMKGSGDLSTSLSASGKSVGGLVASLSGSGTAAFRSLVIAGIDPAALPALVAQADRFGKDIDAAKTAQFAAGIVSAGSFAAAPGEAAFSVAGGVLRAPPVKLANPGAAIEASVQCDINTGTVAASGAVTYEAGSETLVGSEPTLNFTVEGPLGATAVRFDSEPLAQFLTQRALEAEQARVEGMQAALLEKQRLRREVRYYAALQEDHDRAVATWRREREEARKAAEAKRKAEDDARLKAEAEERARQAEAAKAQLAAEQKARAEAEERARLAAEEQERQAAEAARLEAEAAAKAQADEKARLEAEARSQREAEERSRLEAEAAQRDAAQAARAEAEARAEVEAQERAAREAEQAKRDAETASRASDEEARASEPDGGGREAPGEAPPRPQRDVGAPAAQTLAPSAIDGFMRMLQGE